MRRSAPLIRTAAATTVATASAVLVVAGLTGCSAGDGPPPPAAPQAPASPAPTAPTDARARLAALAAAAKDQRMVAFYSWRTPGRADRTVTVTVAGDGSWRVDAPGAASRGAVDLAMVGTPDGGVHQCALPSAGQPGGQCVRVGDRGHPVPARVDPRVQHAFTDWLDVLTDRRAAVSVATAAVPAGMRGACFSLEATAASLAPPVDAGIYCYDPDGRLTGLVAAFGRLALAAPPGPAPPAVALPGPLVAAEPYPVAGAP
ncbi:MAG TPA: hypothetical protein VFM55_08760 [Micromonosporaceae bacterium]|nr:hypothetical protein [Micromonosporaceae bacterium]